MQCPYMGQHFGWVSVSGSRRPMGAGRRGAHAAPVTVYLAVPSIWALKLRARRTDE